MEIPEDYFLDTDDDMLAYLENKATSSIEEAQKSNETNREKGYRLLNYLIAGIGGTAMILLNHSKDMPPSLIAGGLILIIGWSVTVLILLYKVVLSRGRHLIGNLPQNLYNETFKNNSKDSGKLGILRRYELHNSNAYIIHLIKLNAEYRNYADKAIKLAVLTPVIAVIMMAILV